MKSSGLKGGRKSLWKIWSRILHKGNQGGVRGFKKRPRLRTHGGKRNLMKDKEKQGRLFHPGNEWNQCLIFSIVKNHRKE